MNVIAVDVGTTSVRLAIISFEGEHSHYANILASHKIDIDLKQDGSMFEQSSKEIWDAICQCSRECIKKSQVSPDSIRSIAFSATCSLVIQQPQSREVPVNDIIMWMDHRAINESLKITASGSNVLRQFGGVCSPEFSLAKLVWLKKNDPTRFNSAIGFFELPDWLVYRCIGAKSTATCPRSLCCVTCKWGYNVEQGCHCDVLQSLNSGSTDKIGISSPVIGPGMVSGYLDSAVAMELGLARSCSGESNLQDKENLGSLNIAVGTSLIDAHSGMLAMLSIPLKQFNIEQRIDSTLCSLAGTSSCHMLLSSKSNFIQGIWGPYKDVVIQEYYLLEAGQSLTGKLIEISIESHEDGKLRLKNGERMYDIIGGLNEHATNSSKAMNIDKLHILPTFHGNRSPLANPRLRGGVYGLSADGPKSLLEYYVATVESLVYETRLIAEAFGTKLNVVLVSGGLMKNSLYMQTLADVLRCQVIKMSLENVDFMVMGSGLVARHAALSLTGAAGQQLVAKPLTKEDIELINYKQLDIERYQPNSKRFQYHERKYLCYREFVELSKRIDKIMHPSCY